MPPLSMKACGWRSLYNICIGLLYLAYLTHVVYYQSEGELMLSAMEEARNFLRFHSEWEDVDCRKAFAALEGLVAEFECLGRRECYEMYAGTTTVLPGSVDIDQVGRDLGGSGRPESGSAEN
ncbi:hypothetical protein HN766_20345 [Candidatus Poribacteria bacterium]|nr:hypothetical protein [Candidatus Poribacteria bacterium]